MGKKTMKFVRRRKWVRSHRLMGLVQEPSSLFSSMKDLHGNASRTKRKSSATSSVSSGIVNNVNTVNNIKKKSVKKVTISSSRSSISTTHGAIDHEVADADDEDDNDGDNEDDENENDGDNDNDIYDENDEDGMQSNQFPGSLFNPSDPNSGIRPPGTGTDDSNPTLYRQLVRRYRNNYCVFSYLIIIFKTYCIV